MLTAAANREGNVVSQMNQPGANQLVGYRFAAGVDRQNAENEYRLALDEHNATLVNQREEDRRRALEDAVAQRTHSLRAAAINNPAGASASADEEIRRLLRPEAIAQFDALRQSQINENNSTGTGSGRVPDPGNVRPRDQARLDEAHNRSIEARIQQEANGLRAEEGRIRSTVFGAAAQAQAIAAAQARSAARIAALEGQRRTITAAPAATTVTGAGGAATPAQLTQTPAQADPAVVQRRLQQARDALQRGAPRGEVERLLRQQGIDPGTL
jgi:hypothetical protein